MVVLDVMTLSSVLKYGIFCILAERALSAERATQEYLHKYSQSIPSPYYFCYFYSFPRADTQQNERKTPRPPSPARSTRVIQGATH